MKKLLIIAIIQLLIFQSKLMAQSNNSLDKFSNTTWLWTNGTESFKIYLKKATIKLPNSTMEPFDKLIGFHYFNTGNTFIENSYEYLRTGVNEFKWTIILGNQNGATGNKLNGTLRHISKNKTIELYFTVDENGKKATMSLRNTEGIKIAPYDSSISLPNNITLNKVNNDPKLMRE
jgi:hypothetical protein